MELVRRRQRTPIDERERQLGLDELLLGVREEARVRDRWMRREDDLCLSQGRLGIGDERRGFIDVESVHRPDRAARRSDDAPARRQPYLTRLVRGGQWSDGAVDELSELGATRHPPITIEIALLNHPVPGWSARNEEVRRQLPERRNSSAGSAGA